VFVIFAEVPLPLYYGIAGEDSVIPAPGTDFCSIMKIFMALAVFDIAELFFYNRINILYVTLLINNIYPVRNNKNAKVNWQFTAKDARTKLKRLYPTLES
jgi:hypothetical protein